MLNQKRVNPWLVTLEMDVCSDSYTDKDPFQYIKMLSKSYQYRKSHCWDKIVLWPSHLHNGISHYTKDLEVASLYWLRPLMDAARTILYGRWHEWDPQINNHQALPKKAQLQKAPSPQSLMLEVGKAPHSVQVWHHTYTCCGRLRHVLPG